jgi:hypothetical protein
MGRGGERWSDEERAGKLCTSCIGNAGRVNNEGRVNSPWLIQKGGWIHIFYTIVWWNGARSGNEDCASKLSSILQCSLVKNLKTLYTFSIVTVLEIGFII